MKFSKKDMNTGLFILVVFLLILLAGFNIYYQKLINELTEENNKKQEALVEITGKLLLEESKAKEVTQLKEINEKDMEFLEKDYKELSNENEVLKDILEQDNDNGIGSCKASGTAKCPD